MMKSRNRRRAWMMAIVLFPAFGMAQPRDSARITKHEFSIQQAVDYAKKNNVYVKNALLDLALQKEVNRETTARAYPSLSLNGSLTDNLKLQTTLLPGEFLGQPPGTFVPVTFGTKYITSGTVELNQILFDGQVFVGLQARQASLDWRSKNVELTEEGIKVNIYKVYYQLIVSKTQIELLDANITRLQKLEHDTRIMYQNGFAEKLGIDKITVQLANLQTEKQKALNSISNGYYGLKLLLGMPLRDELILTDTISEDEIKAGVLENSAYKYEDRKDYQYLQLTSDFYKYNIRRYKLSKIPTLNLVGSYNKQLQENRFKFNGDWFTASYVSLRLSVPIFSGFATNARIAQASLSVQQLDNQLEGLKLSIDNDVEIAKNNFRTAIEAIDYQKKNLQLATMVYDQTKKKFEAGTGDNTEINQAETDLKTAQTNYINALYDAIIAKVDFLKATGKL